MAAEAPRRRGGEQRIPRPDSWRLGPPAPWSVPTSASTSIEFAALIAAVAARTPSRLAPPFADAHNSAVLIVLHDGLDGAEALFTKRAQHLRNHRGEISFPGGRMDANETVVEAALREAWEEVALQSSLVSVHGELDHLSTVVSNSYIVPVVASVAERPELRAQPDEVERILWVPLAELADEGTYREEWWGLPAMERPIHFFELDDETIWGATALIVHQLLRLAHGVDGPEPMSW